MKWTAPYSRRTFLSRSMAAAAAAGAGSILTGQTAASAARKIGANDRIAVGLIGSGGRGMAGILATLSAPNVDCVALCDVAAFRMEEAGARIDKQLTGEGRKGGKIERYGHYRELLDRKDIDAVIIATPDHWHYRPFVDALAAGKHIYQEKPMSHTFEQGLEMVAAAKKHPELTIQIGTQRRSGKQYLKAKAYIDEGHLGRIVFVRCYDTRNWSVKGDPFVLKGLPEEQVDWKQFEEPCATKHPYDSHRYFAWRWYWDYAGGLVTDVGVHVMDIVHLLTGAGVPKSAVCHGNVCIFDNWETPDVVEAVWDYGTHVVTFTSQFGNGRIGTGLTLYGTKQTLEVRGNDVVVFDEGQPDKPVLEIPAEDGSHYANWIECIRTGKTPNAPVELGHTSLLPSHLANLAYRAGRKITWDAAKQKAT
ncbi:MAG TPA: Gfo/Idh/MocA family oxidoreductase [Phycisphaerae bacterium]|nr:Gfo/Idh/MocA family oxidoreductase [Phycisphaerae bacterium]